MTNKLFKAFSAFWYALIGGIVGGACLVWLFACLGCQDDSTNDIKAPDSVAIPSDFTGKLATPDATYSIVDGEITEVEYR